MGSGMQKIIQRYDHYCKIYIIIKEHADIVFFCTIIKYLMKNFLNSNINLITMEFESNSLKC